MTDDPWRAVRAPFQLPATWQPTFGTCSRCGRDAIRNDGLWWHDDGHGCGLRAEFVPEPED